MPGRGVVGVIGLGIMGSAMAANLMAAGYEVVGYDVAAGRRRLHARRGGRVAASASGVAESAPVVLSALPSVEALDLTAGSLAAARARGRIVVETSTLPIAAKARARRRLAAAGIVLLDCPVSGTGVQARTRGLVVYASGERGAYRRIRPVLDAIARSHRLVGPFGDGSRMKLVANLLVAVHNVAAAEALVLAERAGLDGRLVVDAIGDGAASSRMFEVRAPLMIRRRFSPPAMKLQVWEKDMAIIAEFARRAGAPTPLFSATAPLYAAAARAWPTCDTAAVYDVLRRMRPPQGRRAASAT